MKRVVVTITDIEKSFAYDVDIPLSAQMAVLKGKIIEALGKLDPELDFDPMFTRVLNTRTGKELSADLTAEENGIWNGDYLMFI